MPIIKDRALLRQVSRPTTVEECKATSIFERLLSDLESSPISGVGLTAIQIGVPIRACIIKDNRGETWRMVNPEIIDKYDSMTNQGEGCLSLPGIFVDTDRYHGCGVKWTNYDTGKEVMGVFQGMESICVQHEVDHMDGVTIVERRYAGKPKVGRNDPCTCGSGKKWKKCCGK